MNLIKDILQVDNRIDFGRFQTFIETEAVVSDKKEDVYEIIKTEGYIALKKQEVLDGKIILRGNFNYNVIYLTEDKNTISNMEGRIEINEVIEKDNIVADMENMLFYDVEHIDCTVVNERKIRVGALLNIRGSLFEKNTIDIIKDISQVDSVQKHRKEVQFEDIVGIEKSESVIRDTINISTEDIASIVSIGPRIKLKETRVSDNKVIVGGVLDLNPIAYTYEGELVELDRVGLDFTQFIEVPGVCEGMKEEAMVEIVDLNYVFKKNDETNTGSLEVDCTARAKVKVSEDVTREVLQDAYSPDRNLKFESRNVELNKVINSGSEFFNIRDTIKNNSDDIQIKEIVSVDSNIIVENSLLEDNRNIIEGIVLVDILYTPVEGLRPVYRLTEEIPFTHDIEVENIKDSTNAFNNVNIDRIEFDLNRDQIDVTVKVRRYCEVLDKKKDSFIIKGEDQGPVDLSQRPSITLYIAREGDKLWNIAKKYNTTIDDIAEINEIKADEQLTVGQCLIIEKKTLIEA
ncbi:DUF3794 and LysM peptidoglycan-binding domain-containing protein [Paraclostridium sordellii]|uniref:DUF3794 and LysM peptidoglycan-binding domain-containing protein n=1 Tax=Paraclostridium sordellii TaxID=1505 RepID=UPI0005DD16E4|nr:SPOCS domain-containing protein [Paeniclostridium sordellii]CEO31886.1 cell wall hydrolase [[Clostridium] sordellii] [Paeniclostridium sordellii]CEP49845.1 cell wall hydrolase [[Clostridium] sordellii] [Paeniclostridium sordellii]